jgi:hypothetical protein
MRPHVHRLFFFLPLHASCLDLRFNLSLPHDRLTLCSHGSPGFPLSRAARYALQSADSKCFPFRVLCFERERESVIPYDVSGKGSRTQYLLSCRPLIFGIVARPQLHLVSLLLCTGLMSFLYNELTSDCPYLPSIRDTCTA